jgi:phage/plasmid-associated DNA primase
MDVVGQAVAATGQRLQELRQQNYDQASQRLGAFLKTSTPHITERSCEKTNIIDQGASKTYAFNDDGLSEMFLHLENCRRSGSVVHFSERQGAPAQPYSGLMLDFDIALGARPTGTTPVQACGGAEKQVPAVLDERACRRLCTLVARSLARDLIFRPARSEQSGADEITMHMFYIVRPEATPIKHVYPDGKEGTAFKYGFHLLVPGVRLTRGYKKYLISRLREDEALVKILTGIGAVGTPGACVVRAPADRPHTPLSPVAACLDQNSASVPVLFLGSCKRGGKVYPLGAAYTLRGDLEEFRSGSLGISPIPETTLARYNLCYELALWARPTTEIFRQQSELSPYGAPANSEINQFGLVTPRDYEYRGDIAKHVEATADRLAGGLLSEDEFRDTELRVEELCHKDRDAEYIQQLLALLDESYPNEYSKWRNVIFALYNTGANAEQGVKADDYLPLAEWFSQRAPDKWTRGGKEGLMSLWESAAAGQNQRRNNSEWRPLSKRSIAFWASQCSPLKFRELSNNTYHSALGTYVYKHCGNLGHAMVAEVLHMILGERFVVDITPGAAGGFRYLWYEFVSAGQSMRPGEVWKWRAEAEPDELHKFLSNDLVDIANQIAREIQDRQKDATDDTQAKYYKELGKNLGRTIIKLYDNGFKRHVIEQSRYMFRRRGFLETLDRDADIIGVANGILRIASPTRPKTQLISSYHEWPVSRYTPVRYRPFDPTEPWTVLLMGAMKKIIPEIDMRVWLMMFLATGLYHGLKDPVMLFMVGSGANAKTFAARMTAIVLGDYATKLPIALLTAEREDPSKPNSAAMRLKGRGLAYYEESSKCEVLNTSRLKEVVNPGEMTASDKHKAQEVFDNTATPLSLSNFNFIIEMKDQGTWRRLRYYRAKAKFCPEPDPSNPYEHKDDKRFITEFVNDPECQTAFLSILVFFWEQLQADYKGVISDVPCPTLARETEEYRNSQDVLNRFITERIIASPQSPAFPLALVSARFCEWYVYNIEAGSRRYVATEVIGDLENSVLSRYLTVAPNGMRMVDGCRCLSDAEAAQALQEGECYIGGRGNKAMQQAPRFGPHGEAEPDDWWNWRYSSPDTETPMTPEVPEATPANNFSKETELIGAGGLLEDKKMAEGRLRRDGEATERAEAETEKLRAADALLQEILRAPITQPPVTTPTIPDSGRVANFLRRLGSAEPAKTSGGKTNGGEFCGRPLRSGRKEGRRGLKS